MTRARCEHGHRASWLMPCALLSMRLVLCPTLAGQQSAPSPAISTAPVTGTATAPTRVDLPPSTIYTETLAPAEAIHADIANWSDVEVTAFHAAMVTAKAECSRLEQTPHEGEEALALARLCALGQNWDGTYSAARWYTRASAPPGESQHLALGFGLLLQADLSTPNIRRAIQDLTELNSRLPLSADTDSIFAYAIRALEITQPEAGLQAALLRQPALLAIVAGAPATQPPLSPGQAEADAWHTLALLSLARDSNNEQQQRQSLLDAIGKRAVPLSIPDAYISSRAHAQYEWLGKPLPNVHTTRDTTARQAAGRTSGKPAGVMQPLNKLAETTLLVVEHEDATDVATLSAAVDALRLRLQPSAQARLVLAQTQTINEPGKPSAPVHAVYTDSPLLEQLAASPGPLFVLLNAQGTISYLDTGSAAWLNPQAQAETLLERAAQPAKDNQAAAP